MLGRRGFLGTLLAGAGLIALDPERELWKPGKVISIPPRVHVPQMHHLWASICSPAKNFPGAYIRSISAMDDVAMATHLAREVDKLIAGAGGRTAVFLPFASPRTAVTSHATPQSVVMRDGAEYLSFGPQGRLPMALVRDAYDARSRDYIRCMDVRVRI